MTENKMEQVAAMFGKKLNEDFKANRNNGNWLSCLLTGEAVIVEDEK